MIDRYLESRPESQALRGVYGRGCNHTCMLYYPQPIIDNDLKHVICNVLNISVRSLIQLQPWVKNELAIVLEIPI